MGCGDTKKEKNKLDRCVEYVKQDKGVDNPWAVCNANIKKSADEIARMPMGQFIDTGVPPLQHDQTEVMRMYGKSQDYNPANELFVMDLGEEDRAELMKSSAQGALSEVSSHLISKARDMGIDVDSILSKAQGKHEKKETKAHEDVESAEFERGEEEELKEEGLNKSIALVDLALATIGGTG